MYGDNGIGAQPVHIQGVCGNQCASGSNSANLISDVLAVQMAVRSALLNFPNEIIKKISSYCSDRALRNFGLANRRIASITAPELKFRQKVKESKKIVDSYIDFAGLTELGIKESIKIVEALTGNSVADEIKKNNKEIYIALAGAFKDLAGRIALAGPPSVANGRIYPKIIQGIPPGHRAEIILPNLLVTFYSTRTYLFELKSGMTGEGVIEAVPCVKYGENARHIHLGKCLAVSANEKVIVLQCSERDEIKILAEGSAQSFTSTAVENFRNGKIFCGATGECNISPDGKSLSFLLKRGLHSETLVRGHSNTPIDAKTFKFEFINLCDYGGVSGYNDPDKSHIYHMTQSANHAWSLAAGHGYGEYYHLFFLPLPLGSAPPKIREQKFAAGIIKAAILPDNTIAVISNWKIEIFDAGGSVRAACKIPYCAGGKMQASPDGKTLAVLLDSGGDSECAINFYQLPAATLPGAAATARAIDPPGLVYLWSVPLNGPGEDYDFMFIDYGSKLALSKRDNPGERVIIELTN